MVKEVKIPAQQDPTNSGLVRTLTILASGLTTASLLVNLMLQVASFLKKRPVQPDQRDKLQAAGLTLTVLRTLPGLIKQVRLFADQVRRAA